MRADRLIATMLLLQQRGRMSSRAIAHALEVSPRTVMRDIEALGAAGVPIYSVRGPEGGYQLWEGFRAQLTGLTSQEVGALPLWGHHLAADVLNLGPALDRARLKITLSLESQMQDEISSTEAVFLHDPVPPGAGINLDALRFLATAALRRRAVKAHHAGRNESGLVLYPLALVDKAGRWFLVADSEVERHVLPVEELQSLQNTGQRFRRPDDFDLAAFWEAWINRSRG